MIQGLAVALIQRGYVITMVHSDMGSEYTSRLFETTLANANARPLTTVGSKLITHS